MNASKKRKFDSGDVENSEKRPKVTSDASSDAIQTPAKPTQIDSTAPSTKGKGKVKEKVQGTSNTPEAEESKQKRRIIKLVPPRPWPTVPTSMSATGPASAHREGRNFICLTRKTALGAYMRRCKDLIIKEGYKTLHLSAMGAAIPLLLQLSCSLPPILPYAVDEVHIDVTTGTVEAQDEVIPEDEDQDITYQTRSKSTLLVVIRIGDGAFEGDRSGPVKRHGRHSGGKNSARPAGGKQGGDKGKSKLTGKESSAVVYQEPEQDMMDML
ncbi:hypothetical protein BDQ12DRAFT_726513 [Crucibulum laeve]|uniref:Uncharacterized protein n=1 Tax=Crucibulum laeve TaxID=68775 RepID=A0A5C3LPN6_9AGAR|nr:hypothetical protein BDQ12DRAFT_726513 [Crucibulum laeve]